ncbi:MAG: hypothetical protein R3E96_08845 [Planctomycetota bacterium]
MRSRFFVSYALRRLPRLRITLVTKPEDPDDVTQWSTHRTPVAVVEGVPGPLQKLVVLHRDGKREHIYKLAGTVLARRAIQHEIQALTALHGCGLAPQLVARDWATDPNWFAQQKVQGQRPKPAMTPAVLTWLVSLAAREHDQYAPQVVLPNLYDGRDWGALGVDFRELADRMRHGLEGMLIPCSQSHGDFTPWNTRMVDGLLQAFDWEFYQVKRPALFDAFHYLLQTAVLLRQVPAEQALDRALRVLRTIGRPLTRVAGVHDQELEVMAAMYLLLVTERDSILHRIETPGFDQVSWLAGARALWARQLNERLQYWTPVETLEVA